MAAYRRFDDAEVRRLQLHGSARLTAYLRRALAEGLAAAHLGGEVEAARQLGEVEVEPTTTGPAHDGVGHVRRLGGGGAVPRSSGAGGSSATGSRTSASSWPCPRSAPCSTASPPGWQPAGVGTTDPTSPATALLGLAGHRHVRRHGTPPEGRRPRVHPARRDRDGPADSAPSGSPRARTAAAIAYLALPVAYNALATGQWAGAGRLRGVRRGSWSAWRGPRRSSHSTPNCPTPRRRRSAKRAASPTGRSLHQILSLGSAPRRRGGDRAVDRAAPGGARRSAWSSGSALVGGARCRGAGRSGRVLEVAVGAMVTAAVLLTPWFAVVLARPGTWQVLAGVAPLPTHGARLGPAARFAVGPIGHTPLALGFLVAGALPLWIGARWRLAWAARAWLVVAASMAAAWAAGQGWLGPRGPRPPRSCWPAAGTGLACGHRPRCRGLRDGPAGPSLRLAPSRGGGRRPGRGGRRAAHVGGEPRRTLAPAPDRLRPGHGVDGGTGVPAQRRLPRPVARGSPRHARGRVAGAPGPRLHDERETACPTPPAFGPAPRRVPPPRSARPSRRRSAGRTVRLGRCSPPTPSATWCSSTRSPRRSRARRRRSPTRRRPGGAGLGAQIDLRHVISQGGFDVYVDDAALPFRLRSSRTRATPLEARAPHRAGRRSCAASPIATRSRGRVPAGTVLAAVAPGLDLATRRARRGRVVPAHRGLRLRGRLPGAAPWAP